LLQAMAIVLLVRATVEVSSNEETAAVVRWHRGQVQDLRALPDRPRHGCDRARHLRRDVGAAGDEVGRVRRQQARAGRDALVAGHRARDAGSDAGGVHAVVESAQSFGEQRDEWILVADGAGPTIETLAPTPVTPPGTTQADAHFVDGDIEPLDVLHAGPVEA
jgi:hypothetical protein